MTAPAGTVGVVVYIPDNGESLATLLGLLDTLAHAENWEEFGQATPEEISLRWKDANDNTTTENLYP